MAGEEEATVLVPWVGAVCVVDMAGDSPPVSGARAVCLSLTRRSGDVTGNGAIPCHRVLFDAWAEAPDRITVHGTSGPSDASDPNDTSDTRGTEIPCAT
ncbi:hypothetical protein GCM10010230_09690 [Streptomyces narbonensis]|nr:hypothetical protein GCM10010230_09690 [Streptomyces narbonensis]